MSYANGTTHYNLPQTVGTDKRDWADSNQAFADIDAAIYGAVQDTARAELDIDALEVRMDTAEQNIADNSGDIAALDGRLTTAEGTITQHTAQIADVRQDMEDMICAYNEASATSTHDYAVGDYFIYNNVLYRATQTISIGNTIVPDTNCTTTNVASELLSKGSAPITIIVDFAAYSTISNAFSAIRSLILNVDDFSHKNIQLFSNLEGRLRDVYTLAECEYVDNNFTKLLFNTIIADGSAMSYVVIRMGDVDNSEHVWHITTSATTVTASDLTRSSTAKWMIRIS